MRVLLALLQQRHECGLREIVRRDGGNISRGDVGDEGCKGSCEDLVPGEGLNVFHPPPVYVR